jgi:hypothetical protein
VTVDPIAAFQDAIRQVRREMIPSSREIVSQTLHELGYTDQLVDSEHVRQNFNGYLRGIFEHALEVLERYEEPTYAVDAIDKLADLQRDDLVEARRVMKRAGDDEAAFETAFKWLIRKWYRFLWTLFLSISQSRKTRGGKDFELAISGLLDLMNIPHERQPARYRADFILPSIDVYRRDRNLAIVLSAKRTLRERWQEVVDELQRMNSPNVYLATTDESISLEKQREIAQRNIYLVVWDEVKRALFPDDSLVVGYSEFVNRILTHFEARWPASSDPDNEPTRFS